jgi:Conjugative transposon protein TcpC
LSDSREFASRPTPTVTIASKPLWRLRLVGNLPRYLVNAAAVAGLIASVRFALAPPRQAAASRPLSPGVPATDRAAEGFATLFARRYLSWNAAEPGQAERLLASMAGSEMTPAAGLSLPAEGAQQVEWAEVVQVREPAPGMHVYTVAAETDAAGLLYLSVGVARTVEGRLALSGYPALVGPPAAGGARFAQPTPSVTDAALGRVIRRALRNYLAASSQELEADLAEGARVAVPSVVLTLVEVERLSWSEDRRSVIALVHAHDARGVGYTLDYELDVRNVAGRWEVSAVQMDPDQ